MNTVFNFVPPSFKLNFFLFKLKEMGGNQVMKGLSKILGHSEEVDNEDLAEHKYSAPTNTSLAFLVTVVQTLIKLSHDEQNY